MRTITLNIIKGYGLTPVLNVSQFDKGYTVTATVQKGAEAFTPPVGSTATVEGRKPDGTGYQYAATIDGSTVTFTMAEQMTVLAGRSMAEIVFYNADAVRIGTANFYLLVEEAPLNDSTVISETDLPTIQQALDLLKNGALAPGIINSASGDVVAFSDGARDTALSSLAVNIDPVQSGSGDPSPTNIRPISGWTEAEVTRAGKNLFPKPEVRSQTIRGVTYTINDDGTVSATGTATGGEAQFNMFIGDVLGGHDLLYLAAPVGNTKNINSYVWDGTVGARVKDWSGNASTSDNDHTFRQIRLPKGHDIRLSLRVYSGETVDGDVFTPMFCIPTETNTDYEPYVGETFPVALPTEAGTVYGGVVDPVKGKLTVTKKIVDLGTLNWTYATSNTIFYTQSLAGENAVAAMVCSSYPYAGTAASNGEARDKGDLTLSVYTGTDRRVYIRDDRYTNGAAFKEAVTGQTLVYPLAEPIEYDLTPTQIKTLYGYNTIYADCGSIDSVEYTADTKMYIDSLMTAMQSNIAYIESGTTASRAYTAGQYVIVGGTLYKVTASIASGATFTPGTNITSTTVGAELTALQ